MKQFLAEIKKEWTPLRDSHNYFYGRHSIRWRMRWFLIRANREIAKTIRELVGGADSLFVAIVALLFGYGITEFVDRSDVAILLSDIMNMIITLLSVLIAAAIFISTIHQKNTSRSFDEEISLKKKLIESKNIFPKIYDMFKSSMMTEKKITLLKAIPAVSVSNDHDYRQFKKWHKDAILSIEEREVQPYDRFVLYPYDLVMGVRGARTYYITEAAELSLRILATTKKAFPPSMMKDVEALRGAAERYQTSGSRGYYVPLNYVGAHLMRIILYSLLTIIAISSALLLKDYSVNIFAGFNFYLVDATFIVSIALSVIAFYLILRHIFDFLKYLRWNTRYSSTAFDNFYIFDEDEKARGPESTYL